MPSSKKTKMTLDQMKLHYIYRSYLDRLLKEVTHVEFPREYAEIYRFLFFLRTGTLPEEVKKLTKSKVINNFS